MSATNSNLSARPGLPPWLHNLARRIAGLTSTNAPEWIILFLAALTRFWRLDYHSIWFDEAVSLSWARSDPGYIWQVTFQLVEEKHPPAYYLGLHGWIKLLELVGLAQNDAALRFFGSMLGVLTVLALMLLARRLSGRWTALLAGALAALSPVLVWYSQELRMFQPAATGIVWGAYALLRAWRSDALGPRLGWWLVMVTGLTLALYSYLFSAFVMPAAGLTLLALLIWDAPARRAGLQRFAEGTVALAVSGVLFLPLANNAWNVNAAESTPGVAFADFWANLARLLRIFTVWRPGWPDAVTTLLPIFFGALVLVGLLAPWRRDAPSSHSHRTDRLWLLIWISVPLLIANIMLSRSQSIFREDRYLLFLAPFVLWAVARGVAVIAERKRPAGWILGGMAVLLLAASLPRLWTPALFRENWRAAAGAVVAYQAASPGIPGAVVNHVDYTRRPFEWYARRQMDFDELPIFFPFGGTLQPDQVDEEVAPPLEGLVDFGAETLWLTQSHLDGVDDQRLVEQWLNQRFPLVTELYPSGIKLTGYALQSWYADLPPLGETAVRPATELAPGLTLAACEILTPEMRAQDEELHPPSGWVHVRLWWQPTGPIADDYVATVQMVGPEGVWGDRLYRENEALRRWPTSTWQADTPGRGEYVRDEVDVNLNPVTPPGEYPILVGLLDSTGAPTGDRAECGRVTIRTR